MGGFRENKSVGGGAEEKRPSLSCIYDFLFFLLSGMSGFKYR